MLAKLWILLLLCLPSILWAQDDKPKFEGLLNKLLAPGPLIGGHGELEHKDCLKCHEPAGGIPNQKCADCHKDIRGNIESKTHFHGLMKGKACIDCHKDHKGRAYDSVFFQTKAFDHARTGFDLNGAHARTDCAKCHTETRKTKFTRPSDPRYFGTKDSCLGCHRKDDVHFYKDPFRSKECSTCHSTEKWKPAKNFDHQRDAKYALLGAHSKLKCDKCHVKESSSFGRYDWPLQSKQCLSCHKDHHGDKLSPRFRTGKCDTCHSQDSWKLKL